MFKPVQKEQLKVPGHQDYMPDLREFVNRVGRKYDLAEKLINTFKLAVDEAATNIIQHAYQDQQSHITIQAIVKRKTITFVLIDQGLFFDPNWAEEPNLINSVETGDRPHLGIFLLRKLIDKIEYIKTDAGNELRLTKHRQPAKKPLRLKPSIGPLQIPYSLSLLAVFTILTISFFSYSYNKVEFKRVSDFLFAGKEISTRIANHVSSARADFLKSADGVIYLKTYMQPIYEEKVWQIHSISVADRSGKIIWSTKSAEIQMPFKRPDGVTYITEGIFNYSIDGVVVYEFEKQTFPQKPGFFAGKIRVLFLKDYLHRQIKITEFRYLRNGLLVLGLGYLTIAFLVYLFKHPRKGLIKRPENGRDPQHTTEIANELDYFITRVKENPEWRILDKEIPKIAHPKQIEGKRTDTEIDDKISVEGDRPGLPDSINSVKENGNESEYNVLQLPAPSQSAETAKDVKSKLEPVKRTSPIKAVPEFTLVEFLKHLNSSIETVRAAVTNLSQPLNPKPVQKLKRGPKTAEAIDEDFEIGDISDSLVDALFDDFVGDQIRTVEYDTSTEEPQIQEEKEEVSEKLMEPVEEAPEVKSTEEILTEDGFESEDQKKPQTEIKLLPAPAQKEPLQNEKDETPTEADLETEADSILVESIEDLFSKIRKVHNLISQKDGSAQELSQPESEPDVKAAGELIKIEPESSVVSENGEIEIASELQVEENTVKSKSEADELAEKAEAFLVDGVKHYRRKQYEDAIIAFRNLLKIEPDSKNIYLLLGNAYFKNNMMTDALSVYEQYKKKYPGESIAHENLALIYEKKGVYQLALKEWKAALDLNDDRPDIKRKIEQAVKALKAETQTGGSVKETHTIESKPPQAMAKPNKQDEQRNTLLSEGIYHYRNKNFAAAINSFKVAIRLFPKFKEAYSFLGITYFRYKMFDESEQTFEKLKQLQFESESEHENMGLIYAKQGSYRQAVDEWKKVLTVNPHRTDIKEKINKVNELL